MATIMIAQNKVDEVDTITITQEIVKDALDSLTYLSRGRGHNPLENTALVDQILGNWRSPPNAYNRTYALHCLLTSLIQEEFFRHRHACDLPNPGNECSIREVRSAITLDAQTSNPELISWSWLYYHFVRVEFNISAKEYSKTAFIDDRTLRRYQTHGVWRLTQLLSKKERLILEYLARRHAYPKHRLWGFIKSLRLF